MNFKRLILIWLAVFLFSGCASGGFDSVNKTKQLRPGMKYDEIVGILGEPASSSVEKGKWVVRWNLHQAWKGNVPYDFFFNRKSKRLISWKENEKGYQKNQKVLASFAAAITSATSGGDSGGGAAGDPGPNDPQLMQAVAGRWFSFSSGGTIGGGSTSNMVLCANGTYRSGSESGYSTSGGNVASQGKNGGRWAIQGNTNQGTITLAPNGGSVKRLNYRVCGDGCLYIGGRKYGWAQADCR